MENLHPRHPGNTQGHALSFPELFNLRLHLLVFIFTTWLDFGIIPYKSAPHPQEEAFYIFYKRLNLIPFYMMGFEC
jgi:hypothetical protein